MLKLIANISIRSKLILAFSILIILPICINSIVSYYRMVIFIEDKSINSSHTITQQINTTFDTYFKNIDKLSYEIAYSDNVHQWITNDYANNDNKDYAYGMDLLAAYRFLEGMRKTAYGIDSISVYNNDGRFYYGMSLGSVKSGYKLKDEEWFSKLHDSGGEKVLVGPYEGKFIDISNRKVISLVRKIKDLKKFSDIGYIVIELNMSDMFDNHLKNINRDPGNNIFIINEEGKIIYNNIGQSQVNKSFDQEIFSKIGDLKSGSFQSIYNNKPSLITFYTSSFTNWKVINVTSKNELIKGIDTVRNNSVAVGLVLIVITFIFSIIISNGIVKPIRKLKKMIGKIEQGDFENTIDIDRRDEIGMLTISFNNMSQKLKDLIGQIYIKEEEKRKAEIVALQAQINPHFTYNTLGVVKQMATIQKANGISKMLDSLINLLQSSAKYRDKFITVEEELMLIRSYIYIQETRYCGKFSVEYEYEDTVLEYKTLNLILQPIVENAMFHGIQNKDGFGKIVIRIHIVEDNLQYVIEDDGIGMSQEKINDIFSDNNDNFERLGISNVHKRIKLYFGDSYGISINSRVNEGTRITIIIPLTK